MLLKEYRDGILLFSLMNKEVWEKGIADSLGQVEYFRKNIADYQWGERAEAFIVKVIDSQQLESAKNMLQNQGYNESTITSFESQAASNNPLAFQTESGVFEINAHPVLSLIDRNKSFQEIVSENQTYLVLTGQKFPAGPRKFEESRGLVIRDYQQYLDETLISKLKSKYPVQVNPTIKEETYLALNQ